MNARRSDVIWTAVCLFVGLTLIGLALSPAPPRKPAAPIRYYNVFPAGPNGPKMQLKGNFIKENGFCVEVWLADRIDTIVCPNLLITETEQTSGMAEASVTPVMH